MYLTLVGLRKHIVLSSFMLSLSLLLSSSNRYTSFWSISDCEYTMLTILIWAHIVRTCRHII